MSRLRTRRAALVLGVVGAGLTLLTMSATWGSVAGATAAASPAVLTGREAAPAAFALALAALAGVGVLLLVGGGGRRVVGGLLAVLGVGVAVVAVRAGVDLASLTNAQRRSLPGAIGDAGAVAVHVRPVWAWIAALGGVLVAGSGVLAMLGGPGWPQPSSRYDAPAAATPGDAWRALDQGVDPTLDA